MKRRIQLLLLACMGIAVGAVVAEVALRLFSPNGIPFAVQWGIADDAIEQRASKASQESYGSLTFDADGFRLGSGLPYERSILFLGDSFTEGHGVGDDETFARMTESALRREGVLVGSLNAGHRGFGAAQELKVLRRMLDRLRIDAIVLQSFPMNDLSDNLAYGGFGLADDKLVEHQTPKPPLRARVSQAISQSRLQHLYIVRTIFNAMAGRSGAAPYDDPLSFDLERALLKELVASARRRNIPIVILIIPTKLSQKAPESLSMVHEKEIQRFERIHAFVQGLGVAYVDAGAIIADLDADAAKGDGSHFSRDGNKLIGAALAARLQPLLH